MTPAQFHEATRGYAGYFPSGEVVRLHGRLGVGPVDPRSAYQVGIELDAEATIRGQRTAAGTIVMLDPRMLVIDEQGGLAYDPRFWMARIDPAMRHWLAAHPAWPDDKLAELWSAKPDVGGAKARLLEVRRSLADDPLLTRYIHEKTAAADPATHTTANNSDPWHALAEKYVVAANIAAFGLGTPGSEPLAFDASVRHFLPHTDAEIADRIVQDLLGAEAYLWTREVNRVAVGMPLPKHTIAADILPYARTFWSFEVAYDLRLGSEAGEIVGDENWRLMVETEWGFVVLSDLTRSVDKQSFIRASGVKYGSTYPGEVHDARSLKYLAFVNSPFTDKLATTLPRSIRRERQRAGHAQAGKESLHVIQLRRAPGEPDHGSTREASARNWEHRWWVSGHLRAQWRPSTQDHNVIWIAPYLKGPQDKPLLERRVHAVVR